MSQALLTLLAQTERERDLALAALARAEAQARRLQAQAEQLHQYRSELRGRHPAGAGQAAPIDTVHVHQGFSGRLQDAIDQQHTQRLAALAQVDGQRRALVPLEQRLAAVRKLLGRRAEAAERVQQRRDQRQTDETAQRVAGQPGWAAAADTGPAIALPTHPADRPAAAALSEPTAPVRR